MKIFILTCKAYPRGNQALQALASFLEQRGFELEFVIWQEFELCNHNPALILPLAIWDYALHYKEFLTFLKLLEQKNFKVLNPLTLLKENSTKSYLQKLHKENIKIIPTLFLSPDTKWQELLLNKPFEKAIIKPLVGQSGLGVRQLHQDEKESLLRKEFLNGALVQEFISSVVKNGEYCLIFFNQKFQYAIVRKPQNDFRANALYGLKLSVFKPKKEYIVLASQALQCLDKDKKSLYARVDMIKHNNTIFINEVEFIEPNLYFDYENTSLESFYQALKEKISL